MKTMNWKHTWDRAEEALGKVSKKAMLVALAAALVLSGAGVGAYVATAERKPAVTASRPVYAGNEESTVTDDTVYVIANADGSAEKIIVGDWLQNAQKNRSVAEVGESQGYGMDTRNAYQWNTDGGNITKSEQLPVNVKLTYLLDGKEMTAEEIAGKSGKATIRFEYVNNQKQTVSIDGRDADIYVPFTVVTGAILDDDVFSNVEISNGKIINDGTRSIAIGFALPGMQESLNLNHSSVEIPDSIEITADVKNFSLTTTLTMVTNDLFNEASEKAEEKKEEKGGSELSLDALSSGIHQLVDGSSELYDGTSQLLQKSQLLIEGIHQLAEGGEKVSGGVDTVRQTLQLLCSRNSDLQGGAAKVFDTLLATTQQQIEAAGVECPTLTRSNYAEVLTGIANGMSEENVTSTVRQAVTAEVERGVRATVAAQVEANSDAVTQQVTAGVQQQVRGQVLENVLGNMGMTAEEYEAADEATKETIDRNVDTMTSQQMQTDSVKSMIQSTVEGKMQELIEASMQSAEVQAQINALVESHVSEVLDEKLPAAKDGQKSINAALGQLNAYNEFYRGLCQYTDGVKALYDGTEQLQEGAKSLSDGLDRLDGSTGELADGIERLNNGAMQLSGGMARFGSSSLETLASLTNGDAAGLSVRWQAIKDVSRSYSEQFSPDGHTEESVKFIYRTDAVTE